MQKPSALYDVPPLRMARIRFELRPKSTLRLGVEQRGDILRGSLGENLKRANCDPACRDAKTCLRRNECAYARLFEPLSDKGAMFGAQDAPRPFLLRPSLDLDPEFGPRRPLVFELRLFGAAIDAYAHFLGAFLALTQTRLYGHHVELSSAVSLDWMGRVAVALIDPSRIGQEKPLALDFSWTLDAPADGPRAQIEFMTPTRLNAKDADSTVPSFSALIKRVRDRLSLLSLIWEEKEWRAQYGVIGQLAEEASAVNRDGGPATYVRQSRRTNEKMFMTGFRGTVAYAGVSPKLWPLLRIGQEIHAGRYTEWGLGRYRLVV